MIEFPIPISAFQDWMPHRPPAIFVDEILWVDAIGGSCRARNKAFCDQPALIIEALAQTFGYVSAVQIKLGLISEMSARKKTYLVAIRDYTFSPVTNSEFIFTVEQTHHFAPLIIVKGNVHTPQGVVVARGELKLFSE